jgi:D-tyrosyl-tRNA(Tyr) deacylase
MRLVVQRVTSASVEVDGEIVGAIDRPGLLILAGVTHDDQAATVDRLAEKVWSLRILDGERSCQEENAPILVVSQFTLYADTRKGRRPSWSAAAPRAVSEPLVEAFVSSLRLRGAEVATGVFGAYMAVTLTNDGPMTLILDSYTDLCHLRHGFELLEPWDSGLTETDLRDQYRITASGP